MEKITGYSKGEYFREGNTVYVLQPSGRYYVGAEMMENRIYFGIQGPCSEEEKEATAKIMQLAPTLYEQHFKMLEALDEARSALRSGEYLHSALETVERTIKECEL